MTMRYSILILIGLWMMAGVVSAQSVIPRLAGHSPEIAGWSPDGEWLLLTLRNGNNQDIYRLRIADRALEQLTFDPAYEEFAGWSPDGEWLLFYRSGNLYRMRLDGSAVKALTTLAGQVSLAGWLPDDNGMLLHVLDAPNIDLYRVNLDGSGLQKLTDGQALARQYAAHPGYLAPQAGGYMMAVTFAGWSPDGDWLYLHVSWVDTPYLFRMRPDGSQLERLTDSGGDIFLGWSAEWLIYKSGGQLHRMQADGNTQQQIATTEHYQQWLGWSPDGTWLIFEERQEIDPEPEVVGKTTITNLYRVRPDGTDQQALATTIDYERLIGWSVDGAWLYFDTIEATTSTRTPARLHWQSGAVELLAETGLFGSSEGISGDGQWLVFHARTAESGWDIYRLPAEGGARHNLTADHSGFDGFEGWSPDRTWVITSAFADRVQTYYRLGLEDGRLDPLFEIEHLP